MLILRTNAITQKGVLLVGVNRGLAFYISGTSVDVDLYALREDLFNERYPAAMPARTSWAVASLSRPEGGQAVTAKAGAVLRWARQVVGRDGWDGTLTPKDRRARPKLHHGRRQFHTHIEPVFTQLELQLCTLRQQRVHLYHSFTHCAREKLTVPNAQRLADLQLSLNITRLGS